MAEEKFRNTPTGQIVPDSNSVQRRDIVLGTAGLQTDVDEGLNDKSGGVDFGQQSGAVDQGLGLHDSKFTKAIHLDKT